MSLETTIIRGLAGLYRTDAEPSDDLVDSIRFVDASYDAQTVVRAGYGAGIVGALAPLALLLYGVPVVFVAVFVLASSLAAMHAVHSWPHLRAAFRRTEALGDTPNLVGRAVLRMQIQPSLETAVRFAAGTGEGALSRSLGAHFKRSKGTPYSGLLSFSEEWSEHFPALRRSSTLLATAQDAPEGERGRTLDRALSAILDGTRSQMAEFTAAIRAPTTMLFAFGILLPLALIALVPAAPLAEINLNIWMFVLLYNVVLPIGLIGAALWLLVRRPVAFPPPTIDRNHPDLPDRLWIRAGWGLLAGAGVYAVVEAVGPAYLSEIVAFGVGTGVALLAVYSPILALRRYVRAVEEHLTDALYIVGRQVAEGESVESAIDLAADRVPAETGAVFATAAGVQRRLHTSVEEAFLGAHGALRDVPSQRAHSMAALLAIAGDEGKPAGRAIVSMADHLEELEEVEAETKRALVQVTSTLDNTAAFFGPMVGGATVGMAGMLDPDDFSSGGGMGEAATLPIEQLGIVVAVYLILLACIMTPLSYALRYGMDWTLFGYHVGRALVSSMLLYVLTVALIDIALISPA
ncbi:secretion system protein [Halobacteria archaeon AArc-m2/3/4]|uniref:Secretion system protein n=1 Tax=Natronoglomus mannanivorans TaxID=2979990 RepID=A0AAP3E108_9EURY|nr:secretion system protein [Halobacteria archaeon AArc-xg1-1]MCU4971429.1 secretion system protein [Halobacteria archaeon AArc-m2/3/4]